MPRSTNRCALLVGATDPPTNHNGLNPCPAAAIRSSETTARSRRSESASGNSTVSAFLRRTITRTSTLTWASRTRSSAPIAGRGSASIRGSGPRKRIRRTACSSILIQNSHQSCKEPHLASRGVKEQIRHRAAREFLRARPRKRGQNQREGAISGARSRRSLKKRETCEQRPWQSRLLRLGNAEFLRGHSGALHPRLDLLESDIAGGVGRAVLWL